MRYPKITTLLSTLLLVLCCCLSCSEWDTDSLGSAFLPANSQVRAFTHLVYVEYGGEEVRVWGPAAAEVSATVNGLHVELQNGSDSLALVAYGFPASLDSLGTSDGSLTVRSDAPFALYLSGLSLRSQEQPAIRVQGRAACYVVLTKDSRNHLYGSMEVDGPLNLTGTGSLTLSSHGTAMKAASLRCQYGVSVSIDSEAGDGIQLQGPMQSSMGTWTIQAQQNCISTPDSIVLVAGTYQGSAAEGAFFDAPCGVICRHPVLMTAGAWESVFPDTAYVAHVHHYDSLQVVWSQQIDTLSLQADSLYEIYRNSAKSALTKFRPRRAIANPWIAVTNASLQSDDTLHFVLKPTAQKK